MNIYIIGMTATLIIYILVGVIVSKTVHNAEDYYIAGRGSGTVWITGSLVASFIGVGLFMGDVGESYSGFFAPIITAVGFESLGYLVGAVFFGRYLRRSRAVTIPAYFGQRFDSEAMRKLATITGSLIMLVYILSCVQGIGTLMSGVTGLPYRLCVVMAVAAFTLITVFSGAKGVLVTDTLMYVVFMIATLIGAVVIAKAAGGWTGTVRELATYEKVPGLLAAGGNPSYFYPTTGENLTWAIGYGIAWMSVLMVAPWQSSRYLMAKNEHTVIRSSIIASFSVFLVEFLMCMAGVFTQKLHPGMEDPSQALIWASMNVMPQLLGIIVLSGVLAAGISSATTFLSLIGSNITNDVICIRDPKKNLKWGRITVLLAGVVIGVFCVFQPPQIFWITYLGATIVSCSWLPVAIASVFSKRVTKTGAFCGMLVGFVVSTVLKIAGGVRNINYPIYLDPFFIGMAAGILALVIGSALTQVTEREKAEREKLFQIPEEEFDPVQVRRTKRMMLFGAGIGVVSTVFLLLLWAIPYVQGLHG